VLDEVADWSVDDRQMRYGANEMRIPVKSVAALIFDEMWHPFYVFQVGWGASGRPSGRYSPRCAVLALSIGFSHSPAPPHPAPPHPAPPHPTPPHPTPTPAP
jgi:hypothetical protein